MTNRPRVAITMGDAAGIGPETTVKSLADPRAAEWCIPIVLGDARVLEKAMAAVGMKVPLRKIQGPGDAQGTPGTIEVIDYASIDMGIHRWASSRRARRGRRPLDEGRGRRCAWRRRRRDGVGAAQQGGDARGRVPVRGPDRDPSGS
jgi:hypothetical protein